LVAGLQRYWLQVLGVVVLAAIVGALYAAVSFSPKVAMTVGVGVASRTNGTSSSDAARVTSEVAAALAAPDVVARAESISGANIDSVSAFSAQDSSTVDVVVTAGSSGAASSGAGALVQAYQEVSGEKAKAESDAQVAAIDEALAPLKADQTEVGDRLRLEPTSSGAYAQLNTEYQSLTKQVEDLNTQRSDAVLAGSTSNIVVDVVADPAPSGSLLSSMSRYVPVAIVGALVLCLMAIAVIARRRPWVSGADSASEVLGAPLLAVGQKHSRFLPEPPAEVAPVVGLALQHALSTDRPLALLMPVGRDTDGSLSAGLVARTAHMANDVANVMARNGTTVALVEIGPARGAKFTSTNLEVIDADELWIDGSTNGKEITAALGARGMDVDTLLVVPDADMSHESALDLFDASDAAVLVVLDGELLDPLLAMRREMDSLGHVALGVVVDPPA
jgi:hypothetical protein